MFHYLSKCVSISYVSEPMAPKADIIRSIESVKHCVDTWTCLTARTEVDSLTQGGGGAQKEIRHERLTQRKGKSQSSWLGEREHEEMRQHSKDKGQKEKDDVVIKKDNPLCKKRDDTNDGKFLNARITPPDVTGGNNRSSSTAEGMLALQGVP